MHTHESTSFAHEHTRVWMTPDSSKLVSRLFRSRHTLIMEPCSYDKRLFAVLLLGGWDSNKVARITESNWKGFTRKLWACL